MVGKLRVRAQRGELAGVLEQGEDAQRELVGRGVQARAQQGEADVHQFGVGEVGLGQAVTQQGAELFGGDTLVGARLHATSQWIEHVRQDMVQAAEHWRQVLPARTRPGANTTGTATTAADPPR